GRRRRPRRRGLRLQRPLRGLPGDTSDAAGRPGRDGLPLPGRGPADRVDRPPGPAAGALRRDADPVDPELGRFEVGWPAGDVAWNVTAMNSTLVVKSRSSTSGLTAAAGG